MTERFDLDDGTRNWACSQQGVLDDLGWAWVLQSETGWEDTPDVIDSSGQRPRADGADDAPPLYAARTIQLIGTATPAHECDAAPSDTVIRRFKAMLSRGDRLGQLSGTGESGVTLTANVRLNGRIENVVIPRGTNRVEGFTWKVPVKANDPILYGAKRTASAGLPQPGNGLVFPLQFPLEFGEARPGGRLDIINDGFTDYVSDGVRLYGPAKNVRLVNPATGDLLRTLPGLVIGAGQWVDVNPRDQSAYLNGIAPVSGLVRVDTERWLPIPPGGAQIAFSADSTDGTARVEFDYADANI